MNYAKALKLIRKNKTFLISAHVNIDADALAAELAMTLFLKSLKKKVYIINPEKPKPMFSFFPYVKMVKTHKPKKFNYDVAIIFDCGTMKRIGSVQELLQKDKPIINIDHHITNEYFGDVNIVGPKASSTCEIISGLLKKAKMKLTKPVAQLLYMGIMTDTGSFRYDCTHTQTHAIVSELLKFKFSVSQMYRKLYEDIPLADLKRLAGLLNTMRITHKGRIAYIELTKNKVQKFSNSFDVRDRIFNFLRSTKGIEVAMIFTGVKAQVTRVNFRSQGQVNVGKLAYRFGGGGHAKASGCRLSCSIKQAKQTMLKELNKIFPC